jgi:hypothetical protein
MLSLTTIILITYKIQLKRNCKFHKGAN